MNEEIGKAFLPAPDRMHPLLPFGEYTTKSGLHPLATEARRSKFGNASNTEWDHCYMAHYKFPNGHCVSVISGVPFYCRDDAPFEILWETADEDGDGVHGYVSDEELMILLAKISQYPERK